VIIVTGGTGHIGNVLVKKLLEKGHEVRIIVPPYEDLTPVKELDVQIEFADVRDEEKITSCFRNGSAVFHLASRISIFKKDKKVYEKITSFQERPFQSNSFFPILKKLLVLKSHNSPSIVIRHYFFLILQTFITIYPKKNLPLPLIPFIH